MTDEDGSQDEGQTGGRRRGIALFVLVLTLALAATGVLIFSESARWLRLGVVAALWAALVGAFIAAKYRREISERDGELADLQSVYELELEREVAARREYELKAETEIRDRIEDDTEHQIRTLRDELRVLRESLEALLGGEVLVERVALHAESTRMRPLDPARRAGEERLIEMAGAPVADVPVRRAPIEGFDQRPHTAHREPADPDPIRPAAWSRPHERSDPNRLDPSGERAVPPAPPRATSWTQPRQPEAQLPRSRPAPTQPPTPPVSAQPARPSGPTHHPPDLSSASEVGVPEPSRHRRAAAEGGRRRSDELPRRHPANMPWGAQPVEAGVDGDWTSFREREEGAPEPVRSAIEETQIVPPVTGTGLFDRDPLAPDAEDADPEAPVRHGEQGTLWDIPAAAVARALDIAPREPEISPIGPHVEHPAEDALFDYPPAEDGLFGSHRAAGPEPPRRRPGAADWGRSRHRSRDEIEPVDFGAPEALASWEMPAYGGESHDVAQYGAEQYGAEQHDYYARSARGFPARSNDSEPRDGYHAQAGGHHAQPSNVHHAFTSNGRNGSDIWEAGGFPARPDLPSSNGHHGTSNNGHDAGRRADYHGNHQGGYHAPPQPASRHRVEELQSADAGAHASGGPSVTELLASYGADTARHRRRRED